MFEGGSGVVLSDVLAGGGEELPEGLQFGAIRVSRGGCLEVFCGGEEEVECGFCGDGVVELFLGSAEAFGGEVGSDD